MHNLSCRRALCHVAAVTLVLGLALVAQAVARCGGTVRADPGPGARFVVALPYRPGPHPPTSVPDAARPAPPGAADPWPDPSPPTVVRQETPR